MRQPDVCHVLALSSLHKWPQMTFAWRKYKNGLCQMWQRTTPNLGTWQLFDGITWYKNFVAQSTSRCRRFCCLTLKRFLLIRTFQKVFSHFSKQVVCAAEEEFCRCDRRLNHSGRQTRPATRTPPKNWCVFFLSRNDHADERGRTVCTAKYIGHHGDLRLLGVFVSLTHVGLPDKGAFW